MTAIATPTATALDRLAEVLPGRVHLPTDPDWDAHRLPWALAVNQQPVAVVDAASAAEVATAVRCAAENDLAVSVQPVGHGATLALSGTVLIRTRALDELHIDVDRRIARVGAGVKWGEVLQAAAPHGLIGLAGSSSDPSVTGFSVGGGLSWFGRAYGLAAHHIRAVELVDATGAQRRVTAESDPDLFWAVRGGGGDFAIVTALEFDLFPAPHVYGGRMMWPIELAQPVLRAFQRVTAVAPDELTVWTHVLRFPPLPTIPEPLRGGSFVSIEATFLGSAEDAEPYLAEFRAIPALFMDTMGTVDPARLGDICAEPVDPMPTLEWSSMLVDLDDAAVDALLAEVGHAAATPIMIVQVRHLGGAFARATDADGPAGAITEPYQLFALGVPIGPEIVAALESAYADLQIALGEHRSERTAFTFLTGSDPSRAFPSEALGRLRAIKAAVDPYGVIRSNRPVG